MAPVRTKKELRKKTVVRRKNFLGLFVLTGFLWFSIFIIVYFVDPQYPWAIPLMLLTLLSALFVTCTAIFENKRRGALISIAIVLFLLLRIIGIGNVLNFILIMAIAITIEIYYSKRL